VHTQRVQSGTSSLHLHSSIDPAARDRFSNSMTAGMRAFAQWRLTDFDILSPVCTSLHLKVVRMHCSLTGQVGLTFLN
jgi:hypothetical protein